MFRRIHLAEGVKVASKENSFRKKDRKKVDEPLSDLQSSKWKCQD
jgi:hypothetical protein